MHVVGLLDDTAQDLMSTAEARLEANSTYGQERRNAFLELTESGFGESKAVAPNVSDENRARGHLARLRSMRLADGRPLSVVELPMPAPVCTLRTR